MKKTTTTNANTKIIVNSAVEITLNKAGAILFDHPDFTAVNWAKNGGTDSAAIAARAERLYITLCEIATISADAAVRQSSGGALRDDTKKVLGDKRDLAAREFRELCNLFAVRTVNGKPCKNAVVCENHNVDFLLLDVASSRTGKNCTLATYLKRVAKTCKHILNGGTYECLTEKERDVDGNAPKKLTETQKRKAAEAKVEALEESLKSEREARAMDKKRTQDTTARVLAAIEAAKKAGELTDAGYDAIMASFTK